MKKLEELLAEWSDPLGVREMSDAEELIDLLRSELAGKEEVIKALHEDIRYYRKDWKEQMIQDEGLEGS